MKKRLSEIKRVEAPDHSFGENEIFFEKVLLEESFPLHWHGFCEIEYIMSGRAEETLNGVKNDISDGNLHILTPSDFHEIIIKDDPVLIYKACFDLNLIDHSLSSRLLSLSHMPILHLEGEEKKLIEQIFLSMERADACIDDHEILQTVLHGLINSILASVIFMSEDLDPGLRIARYDDTICTVLNLIHKDFCSGVNLSKLANAVYLSPSHLSRKFHSSVGMSIGDYVKRLRMDMVTRLLVTSDYSITDICYEVGFVSLPTFSLEFKRIYGVTPSDYRRINQKRGA